VIKAWVKNGLLVGFDYTNRDSKVVKGVKVNETIKDELLGALRGTRAPPSAFSDGGLMADDIFRRDEPSLKENLMAESPPPSGFPDGGPTTKNRPIECSAPRQESGALAAAAAAT
jgi:hypothetical protein